MSDDAPDPCPRYMPVTSSAHGYGTQLAIPQFAHGPAA